MVAMPPNRITRHTGILMRNWLPVFFYPPVASPQALPAIMAVL
jgi:hypothetical protein